MQRLQKQTATLTELITEHTPGWEPSPLARHVLIQTHFHQHAVMGFEDDLSLMASMGVDPEVLDSGCCSLAMNFGLKRATMRFHKHERTGSCSRHCALPPRNTWSWPTGSAAGPK